MEIEGNETKRNEWKRQNAPNKNEKGETSNLQANVKQSLGK